MKWNYNIDCKIKFVLSLLFGGLVFLYWYRYYPHHLHYQEQLQLFLFTVDYLEMKIAHPGGVAEYIAEFLTQFFVYAWVGAIVIAVTLVIIQLLMNGFAKKLNALDFWYPLSFLPSVCLWIFLCDQNALLALPVSILLTLSVLLIWVRLTRTWVRIAYAIFIIPVLYWMVGGVYFIFVLGLVGCSFIRGRQTMKSFYSFLFVCVCILLAILCPLLAKDLVQYSLLRLIFGIDYYRYPMVFPSIMLLAMAAPAIVPWIQKSLPMIRKHALLWISFEFLILLLGAFYAIRKSSNPELEEALKYDYLTRMGRWEQIIQSAEKAAPESPLAVTCLNLALARTGQLGDRMFHFYQNGTEGLIPRFNRDFTTPLPASEVFYYLGMINASQHYTFEAMEAIPDHKKSGRAYVRLAETNLINGQYEVAAKYLKTLRYAPFYRRWAINAMSYLYNEEKIERHPEWGWLRKIRYTEDFLFSETEMDAMLGLLFQHNMRNRMAFDYLLAYVLQKKDLKHFMEYYPLGEKIAYDHIPLSYQEALAFVWIQKYPDFQGIPWPISESVLKGMTDFIHIYSTLENPEPILRSRYGKTYWYYLLYRK